MSLASPSRELSSTMSSTVPALVLLLCGLGALLFLGLCRRKTTSAAKAPAAAPKAQAQQPAPQAQQRQQQQQQQQQQQAPAANAPVGHNEALNTTRRRNAAPRPAAAGGDVLFNPNRSAIAPDQHALALAVRADDDVSALPTVGTATAAALAKHDITMVCQLMGKFLTLRAAGMTTQEHCDAFWAWLRDIGVGAHRGAIVRIIAEKTDLIMPGVYNPEDVAHD